MQQSVDVLQKMMNNRVERGLCPPETSLSDRRQQGHDSPLSELGVFFCPA